MNKKTKAFLDEFVRQYGNEPVKIPLKEAVDGMDKLFEVLNMNVDLIQLIQKESNLKKHHRAYLHVREELDRTADKQLARMEEIIDEFMNHGGDTSCANCVCSGCDDCKTCLLSPCGKDAKDEEPDCGECVVMSKADFDSMVDDVLTLAELVDMVCHFRCEDLAVLSKYAKLLPELANYEHRRVSVYKDAAFEAEAIMDRWDDAELSIIAELD
ncbi:hypothetical protein SDC9_36741 [bioreactor metagenome]|uniref:Uncharacterized protein n=1 Tax=bioreactor metagenome TaxID=1076179 RepID=A0A644VH96_9ZZZZ